MCLDIAAGGHAFPRGELPHADARRTADGDEQRDLAPRHAQRVHFAAELAGELEEHRTQPSSRRQEGRWRQRWQAIR